MTTERIGRLRPFSETETVQLALNINPSRRAARG